MRVHRLLSVIAIVAGTFVTPQVLAEDVEFDTRLNMNQLMLWVLDPPSNVIWEATGSIYTEEGEISMVPTDQQGWERVRNNAAVVVETGNLLMMPGRSEDDGPWMAFSQMLIEAGMKAIAAAEARSEDQLFMAGNDLYDACAGCHAVYLVDEVESSLQ